MGSKITQDAAVLNIQSTFGWVTHAKDVLRAIRPVVNGITKGDH
jgi:hypothetical protein